MNALNTCINHQNGRAVVIHQGNGACPLCTAEATIEDLKQQVEDLEGERDSLQLEVDALGDGR